MKHTILVVEDDVDASETLRDVLSDEGYDVVCARDGAEALTRAAGVEHLCLVFLDLFLPNMDGWQFFAAFRADSRFDNVPVVVTTSAPERAPIGATRVLTKPISLDHLISAAGEYC